MNIEPQKLPTPLLTAKDVSRQLNISISAIYGLIRSGDLPSVRIGRSVRVRPEDLDTFILHRLTADFAYRLFQQVTDTSTATGANEAEK